MDYELDYLDELQFEQPDESDDDLLPAYLREAPLPRRTFGTLSYNRRSKCWTVKGDPSVTEMCKRLFPGSAGSRRGEARFTAHRRMVGDLMWLMLRFPLEVAPRDRALWDKAVQECRDHAIRKEIASRLPERMTPPEGTFTGELRPFQQEGLAFLLQHDRCLLADEMGLGKTVQALSYLASTDSFPALVIPPAHLTRNWTEEACRFLRLDGEMPRVHVIRGLKPYDLPEADVYVMHYLLLRGWKEVLPTLGFRAVIFDEVQELRHTGTEKYSAASLLSESCERVIGLSGTPIYNTGGEIWNVINILDYHFLGDWESFSREWCYGYGNAVVVKPDLLGAYLRREGLMLRRTKQEVLKELPPKRRAVQELDWNDKLYAQLMAPVLPDVIRWKQDGTLTPQTRAMLEESISQHVRQATGVAKAPYVCQFVRALLDAGEKVLLFAHHHAVMDTYKDELKHYHPGFITGRETIAAKAQAVDRFMAGKTDVLCISLRAASGLNLQRATCVVFGELDWSPAVHSQAEDRAHRMGQEDSLLCYYLVAPQGSDAVMQEALGLKVSQFVGLMGDTPASPAEAAAAASQARRHVEWIAAQMSDMA
ncbi:MAG: DEAD/DEAH box helicase [Clostridiales bacterium]|nr:DEAD/DEAH box helicase [Clostridiales bacterium]